MVDGIERPVGLDGFTVIVVVDVRGLVVVGPEAVVPSGFIENQLLPEFFCQITWLT
jgi:hypothetical protein